MGPTCSEFVCTAPFRVLGTDLSFVLPINWFDQPVITLFQGAKGPWRGPTVQVTTSPPYNKLPERETPIVV